MILSNNVERSNFAQTRQKVAKTHAADSLEQANDESVASYNFNFHTFLQFARDQHSVGFLLVRQQFRDQLIVHLPHIQFVWNDTTQRVLPNNRTLTHSKVKIQRSTQVTFLSVTLVDGRPKWWSSSTPSLPFS